MLKKYSVRRHPRNPSTTRQGSGAVLPRQGLLGLVALSGGLAALSGGCAAPTKSDVAQATENMPAMTGDISKCPVMSPAQRHTAAGAYSNGDWWPNQLNLAILHQQSPASSPMGPDFDYAKEFAKLDMAALKKALKVELIETAAKAK